MTDDGQTEPLLAEIIFSVKIILPTLIFMMHKKAIGGCDVIGLKSRWRLVNIGISVKTMAM